MRPEVLNSVSDNRRLDAATAIAREIYRLHEAGGDYAPQLQEFARILGKSVPQFDVDAAFGSISPESFAEGLLMDRSRMPKDLSESEMLELIERICKADGTESQISYWLNCLEVNAGDDRISDLIFWPGEYFGGDDNGRELTPHEILRTAMAKGHRAAG
jgi:hypothetical protein